MHGLQIELVIGLVRDEAHVLAFHGFGDRLCIHQVVLVGLYKWLHKLCCHSSGSSRLLTVKDDPTHPVYLLTDSYVGYRFHDA
jgi:hypothetical protein